MGNRNPDQCRRGFTLLETILAVAISVIVVALLYSVYHTALRVARGQQVRRQGAEAALHTLDLLRRDLSCGLTLDTESEPALLLELDPTNKVTRLHLLTAVSSSSEGLWYAIERVAWEVVATGTVRRLVRRAEPLTGPRPDPPDIEILMDDPSIFSIKVRRGDEWVDQWPVEKDDGWPPSARIAVAGAATEKPYATEVFIPVGNVITSSLTRARAAGRTMER